MSLFPSGRRFAFSVLDDTDDSTLANVGPVYALLREYGLRTTKTAWPLDCPEGSRHFFAAETLQDKAYLSFVHDLVDDGFELAFHGATMESSPRVRTLEALEFLRSEFGRYPRLFCNHGQNRENLYWGTQRFQSPVFRWLSRRLFGDHGDVYEGHCEESPFFWGDVARGMIEYVRNFTFDRLNLLEVDPETPYHVANAPYVRHWFSTTDAPDVEAFNRLVSRERIDQLEAEGGVCIISTHFGKGFVRDGRVNPETASLLRHLSAKAGWFAPVSEVLDRLRADGRGRRLSRRKLLQLELRFIAGRVRRRRLPGV